MPVKKMYDLFISHAWRYNESYDRLVEMLIHASGFDVRIHSAYKFDMLNPNRPGDKPILLKDLEDQINPVNCVLVISGMYAGYREWIQAAIDIAKKHDKPIIGVKPPGRQQVPPELQDAANTLVNWESDEIIDQIKTLSVSATLTCHDRF